jgi:hypothetical protein
MYFKKPKGCPDYAIELDFSQIRSKKRQISMSCEQVAPPCTYVSKVDCKYALN